MRRLPSLLQLLLVGLAGCAVTAERPALTELQRQVIDTEKAFARTMADRNFAAFTTFLSQDAVFFSGPNPLRGRNAVATWWKRYYEPPQAPFSWEPDQVEVLASGSLALSTGPVRDPQGKLIGRFNSVWRREPRGNWLIVFDKGEPATERPGP